MKYWVFDLDGTLIDSHTAYFDMLRGIFNQQGASFTSDDERDLLRISAKDRESFFSARLGPQGARAALAEIARQEQNDFFAGHEPFGGIRETLELLVSAQAKIAVWTARERPAAEKALEVSRLRHYFSFLVTASCVARCKPHPEGLHRVSQNFGCSPSSLIMVGDHENDVMAAKACGARSIRAFWNRPDNRVGCSISDHQFHSVFELKHWLFIGANSRPPQPSDSN